MRGINLEMRELFDKLPDNFLAVGTTRDGPVVVPSSVEELLVRAKRSPVGKGNETVFDESVRKSAEEAGEECPVSWDSLTAVLSEVSRELVQGRPLRAEAYKALIYQEGDFFKWHRDSKKGDNHVMTLCVDTGLDKCKGGTLEFATIADEDKVDDDSHSALWGGGVAGSYACWFAGHFHCVNKVKSGRRVVVIYNLFLDVGCDYLPFRVQPVAFVQVSNVFACLAKDVSNKVSLVVMFLGSKKLFNFEQRP